MFISNRETHLTRRKNGQTKGEEKRREERADHLFALPPTLSHSKRCVQKETDKHKHQHKDRKQESIRRRKEEASLLQPYGPSFLLPFDTNLQLVSLLSDLKIHRTP
mmetsp:Transcript_24160/g.47494  ORF Transcript_24160/g.47494 Transcript_24160/m.47494 type:complete len:106 (-) Transcript_24160:157-474(-)